MKDSNFLITKFCTHDQIPSDFSFTDTQDLMKKKIGLKPVSILSLLNVEDQLSTLPVKTGKKKALERLKSIDKEMMEIEKQRQSITTILATYKDPAPEKILNELTGHRDSMDQNLNSLLSKKHVLHVYIAAIDGKPTPIAPATFGARSNESPTASNFSISPSSPFKRTNTESMLTERVVALFDFEAAAGSEEISLKAGEVLSLIEMKTDGWAKCRSDHGAEGYVPSTYIEMIE